MYFKKYLLCIFMVVLLCCTCYCESGMNELYENNIFEFSSSDMKSLFIENVKDLDLILHNDTSWSADEKDCKCKNGRCERTCSEVKDGVCLGLKQVCVCDPEFGKYDDHTCIYCKCGKGFNCTIERDRLGSSRVCVCPEGYRDYSGECAVFCSDSQPCQNGGTCQDGRCNCMKGTHGPFCERIFWCAYECRARLTVACVYNQNEQTYACECKNRSLVFDYKEAICKPCPCGEGTCKVERHELHCDCKEGYKEFQTQCKKCDCGRDHDCELHWRTGEKICKCQKGYIEREGTCQRCGCGHYEATCNLDNVGRKFCICPEGYEDHLGLCQKIKENCTCHPTAKCIEKGDGFSCACEDGYIGERHDLPLPEEPCIDIDECQEVTPERCPRRDNQKCINFPGSYMCQCMTGYKPITLNADGSKIKCEIYKASWLPTGITIGVIIAFMAISVGFILFQKKRESSMSRQGMEMRTSR